METWAACATATVTGVLGVLGTLVATRAQRHAVREQSRTVSIPEAYSRLVHTLQGEIERLRAEVGELRAQNAGLRVEVDGLRVEVDTLRRENGELLGHIARLQPRPV